MTFNLTFKLVYFRYFARFHLVPKYLFDKLVQFNIGPVWSLYLLNHVFAHRGLCVHCCLVKFKTRICRNHRQKTGQTLLYNLQRKMKMFKQSYYGIMFNNVKFSIFQGLWLDCSCRRVQSRKKTASLHYVYIPDLPCESIVRWYRSIPHCQSFLVLALAVDVAYCAYKRNEIWT